ncbi:MAG: TetR/AcrR family transcriptional regulator [Deltaproteobacteria bacterium]|nr:TetR/AcrR family transcriptional regulator [Deltaproteobacteria bacterium]
MIYQGCQRVLAAYGFSRVTTRLIAQVAGVGVGTLYRYFSDREALFSEMYTELARRLVADVIPSPAQAPWPLSVAEFTERILRRFLYRLRENRVTVLELARNRHRFETRRQQRRRELLFQSAIAALVEEHLDVEDTTLCAFVTQHAVEATVMGALIDHPEMLDDDRLIDEVTRMLAPYLASRSRSPTARRGAAPRWSEG